MSDEKLGNTRKKPQVTRRGQRTIASEHNSIVEAAKEVSESSSLNQSAPPSPAILSPSADRDTLRIPLSGALKYTANGFIDFYNLMHEGRGFEFPPHLVHFAWALTDERIRKLCVILGPGSGKSLAMSTVFPAFSLGIDPTMTQLGVSAGEALMQGFMSAVMEWIEHHPMWKALFPKVTPDKGKGWSTERGMFVSGHSPGDPDASFLACGLTSKRLTGVHARLILGDDIHDEENSLSADSCMRVRQTFYRQLMGRADPRGARFIFAGRRWHDEDLYGHLKSTGEWVVLNLPAMRDGNELYWDITVPDGLECCFTEWVRGQEPSNYGHRIPRPDEDILQAARQYTHDQQEAEKHLNG